MKVIVSRKEFADALKNVLKGTAVKPMTPILAGVYLKAEGSTLEMQATDHTIGITTKIPAVAEESGETVIIGKKLFEMVLKLTGDTLTLKADDTNAEIRSAGTKYNLFVINPADFPKMQDEETTKEISLTQRKMKNFLKKTVYAAADDKETSRPIFTGVLFKAEGEKLTVAATNTHRIAIVYDKLDEPISDFEYLIPAKTLQEVLGMLSEEGKIKIAFTEKNANLIFDNMKVRTRLIAGNFPNFDNLLNEEKNIEVQVSTQEFFEAIERVAIIAKETEYHTVNLDFEEKEIKISSSSAEVGKAEEIVQAEIEGGDLQISFNYKYLTDVLKVIDAEKICVKMSEKLKPIEFQEEDYRYVVTPVRTA